MNGENQEPPRRLPRRLVIALVAVVLILATCTSDDDGVAGATASTATSVVSDLGFPEPEPGSSAADREYLQDEGRVLLAMHEHATEFLRSESAAEQCRQEAQTLDEAAPADHVLSRIGGVSDEVLRDALHAERTAFGLALTQCIAGEGVREDSSVELEQAVDAVAVRLRDLAD